MDKRENTAAERAEVLAVDATERAERLEAEEANLEAEVQDAEEIDLVVKFRKPYEFEGQTYTEVDLSGLEDTKGGQLENVGRQLLKKRPGLNPSTIEMTMDYATMLASRVSGKPVEFFERLPGKEAMKIKNTVVGFLYGGDGED